MNKKFIYTGLLTLQCAIFGFHYIVLQILFKTNCPSYLLVSIQFIIGAVALLLTGLVVPSESILSVKFDKKSGFIGALCGCVLSIAFALQTKGAEYTTPANNALFTGLFVIFVPIITLILSKKFDYKILLYSLLSIIGVAFLSDFTLPFESINIGDILSILCGLSFAIHFLLLEKYTQDVNLSFFTVAQLFTVSVVSGIMSLAIERKEYIDIMWHKAIFWLIFTGIASTAITYIIQSYVQSKIPADEVSIISCSESVFAIIFSLLFGYDRLTLKLILGCFLIIVPMIMVTIHTNDKEKTR